MTMKDAKLGFVTDGAVKLFLTGSISGVTVKDIAKECGVGEATVYRYFSTKSDLIIACAVKLQKKVEKLFLKSGVADKNGVERLESFYGTFLDIYREKPELYRFLSEFDAYCISESDGALDEYADNMDRFKAAFLSAYRDGVRDGSVREINDLETFYYSTTHALLSLCKKLTAQREIVRQDKLTDGESEVAELINIILFSLKA